MHQTHTYLYTHTIHIAAHNYRRHCVIRLIIHRRYSYRYTPILVIFDKVTCLRIVFLSFLCLNVYARNEKVRMKRNNRTDEETAAHCMHCDYKIVTNFDFDKRKALTRRM